MSNSQVTKSTTIHAKAGDEHVVVSALRVLIQKDGEYWVAQGLEIDYAASGDSIDNVKQNFSKGFELTLLEHLKLFGNLKKFLQVAPQSAWAEFFEASNSDTCEKTACVIGMQCTIKAKEDAGFPFDGYKFIAPERLALAA